MLTLILHRLISHKFISYSNDLLKTNTPLSNVSRIFTTLEFYLKHQQALFWPQFIELGYTLRLYDGDCCTYIPSGYYFKCFRSCCAEITSFRIYVLIAQNVCKTNEEQLKPSKFAIGLRMNTNQDLMKFLIIYANTKAQRN